MPKQLKVTLSIPVRENQALIDHTVIQDAIRLIPSAIDEAHTLIIDGEILVDSLAEIVDATVIEE